MIKSIIIISSLLISYSFANAETYVITNGTDYGEKYLETHGVAPLGITNKLKIVYQTDDSKRCIFSFPSVIIEDSAKSGIFEVRNSKSFTQVNKETLDLHKRLEILFKVINDKYPELIDDEGNIEITGSTRISEEYITIIEKQMALLCSK